MSALPEEHYQDDDGDELDVNSVGGAIMSYADTYRNIFLMILEMIQNAMDANATAIWVVINRKKRYISVRDNGDGVDREDFRLALKSIGKSVKDKKAGKLGQFGRGLITPLGKCEKFTFTSQKKGAPGAQMPYLRWTFVSDEIANSQAAPKIVPEEVDLFFDRKSKTKAKNAVPWRTAVEIFNFTKDRTKSRVDINELATEAVNKYRDKMLENDVRLFIREEKTDGRAVQKEIKAKLYDGEPLKAVKLESPEGFTKFDIYLSRRSGKSYNGQGLSFSRVGDPFSLTLDAVLGGPLSADIPSEMVKALQSGVFEGKIVSNHLDVHPSREHFEENDGLVAFILKFIEWFETTGQGHYEDNASSLESERFQKNAKTVIDGIKKLIESSGFASLLPNAPIKKSQGVGPFIKDPEGPDVADVGGTDRNPNPKPRKKPTKPGNNPPGDPDGRHGDGDLPTPGRFTGFTFEDSTEGGSWIWRFHAKKTNVIQVNIEHMSYSMCNDKGDKAIQEFMAQIFFHAVNLFNCENEDERLLLELYGENLLSLQAYHISS
jgi:hypothetical protein